MHVKCRLYRIRKENWAYKYAYIWTGHRLSEMSEISLHFGVEIRIVRCQAKGSVEPFVRKKVI